MSIPTIRSWALAISLGCLFLTSPKGAAQNLVDFNFFNNTSNNQILTTANTAGLFNTASGWSVVGNQISLVAANATSQARSFGGKNWPTSTATDHYYSFGLTNGTGSAVSIASLTLRVSAPANHGMTFEVQTSVAGFSGTGTGPTWNFNVANGSTQSHTFDLGTQTVANGATIDFRVLGYNSTGTADEFWLDSSGGINGTTALFVTPVPEPTTMIGIAAFGMLTFRQLRRWKSK